MANKLSAEELERIKAQEYLRITEAAILGRKSRQTVYDAIHAYELAALRHGGYWLIRRRELDAWMDRLAEREQRYADFLA